MPRPRPVPNHHLRHILVRRDHGRCWLCGRRKAINPSMDHLLPRAYFPDETVKLFGDRFSNLATACLDCNANRGSALIPFEPRLDVVFDCALEVAGDRGVHVWCAEHEHIAWVSPVTRVLTLWSAHWVAHPNLQGDLVYALAGDLGVRA